MSTDIPAGWNLTTIGSVIERHFSGPSPTCEERNIAASQEWGVLKTTAITWAGWNPLAHKVLPPQYWGQEHLRVLEGDVIITKAGPRHRCGVVTHVTSVPENIIVSGKMIGLHPRRDLVVPRVLAAALATDRAQKHLDARTTGMAESQVNFTNEELLSTPVILPPFCEQRRIAKILDTADQAIRGTERVITKLKNMKQGLLHDLLTRGLDENGELRDPERRPEMFKDSPLGRIPGQWKLGGIHQFLQPHDGIKPGPFGSSITKRMYRSEGYRVYGQEQVIAGDLSVGDYYISPSKYFEMKTFSLQEGDLLISLVGTIGRVLVVRSPFEPGVINPRLIRLRPARDEADVEFLKHLMISEILQQQLENMAQGGTMPVLSGRILRKLILARPPLQEQSRIAAILDAQDGLISLEKQTLGELRQVKQGLMDDLLTGRVRVRHTEGTET